MTGSARPGARDQRVPGGVDLYVGGTEHAVLHLLYARFWHKVLHDLGYLSTSEPFQRLINQGTILGPDNQKMSKSRGNVVNPEDVIADYGADSLRLYEMFMGPLEQTKPWSMKGVEGVYRFLGRVWRLAMEETQEGAWMLSPALSEIELTPQQLRIVHATIKKAGEDIEAFAFNTAISQLMIFTNELVGLKPRPLAGLRTLLPLLSPFAPHIAEELWKRLGERFAGFEGRASAQPWPSYNPERLVVDELEYGVQVDGKIRERMRARKNASDEELGKAALSGPKVKEAGKEKRCRRSSSWRKIGQYRLEEIGTGSSFFHVLVQHHPPKFRIMEVLSEQEWHVRREHHQQRWPVDRPATCADQRTKAIRWKTFFSNTMPTALESS
jgi:leucyl-tRNA synthetase